MKVQDILLPIAIDKLGEGNAFKNEISTYAGYLSSFGAAVNSSGLLAALAFNHSDSEAGKKRKKMMTVIFNILKEYKKEIYDSSENNLFRFCYSANKDSLPAIKKDILNAATAVKLSLRTLNS